MNDEQQKLVAVFKEAQRQANANDFPVSVWWYDHLQNFSSRVYYHKRGSFICSIAPQVKTKERVAKIQEDV